MQCKLVPLACVSVLLAVHVSLQSKLSSGADSLCEKKNNKKKYNGGCGGGDGGDADKISYREIARVRIKTMLEFRRW